jgi:hypothetical protein
MKRKVTILLGAFVLLAGITASFVIHAQQANNGLSVHPSSFNLSAGAGQSTTNTVTLDNLTSETVTIQAELRNFTAKGEQGGVALTQDDTTYSLAKWITVTPNNVTLAPHTSQKFTFTITTPYNAEPGGHFGSIVFATVPPPASKGVGAVLSEQIASLILLEIPGNVKEQADVVSFDTDKPFYEFGPVNFTTRVRNDGDVHIQPSGAILVKGMFGQEFNVPIQQLNVLPNAIRIIPATLNKHFLIGKYDATLVSVYGTKNEQLSGTTEFYAFPIRYGLILLGILLILFLFKKRLGKAFKALLTGK